jgi:hypothetical protein
LQQCKSRLSALFGAALIVLLAKGYRHGHKPVPQHSSKCGDQAASFTRLPFQRIEKIVKPTGQQQTALEKLQQVSQQAADDLRASCPMRTAEPPAAARLDAMNSRLAAMVGAVKTLRPALGSFTRR